MKEAEARVLVATVVAVTATEVAATATEAVERVD